MADTIPLPNPNAPLAGAAQHVDRQGLTVILWTTCAVAFMFVCLRLFARLRDAKRLLPDDYWMMLAWVTLLTEVSIITKQTDSLWYTTYLTAGRIALSEETLVQSRELVRWQFPAIKLFWSVLWCVKASFLALFYRLLKPLPLFRKLWYGVVVFTILAYIGCWLSSVFTCIPPSNYFKPGQCETPRDKWGSTFAISFSTAVDITSDLLIMSLPLAILPSLQLDFRKKVGLAVVFSLGCIIISVAIVRMTQVLRAERVDLVGLAIWSTVESGVAVIVGSMPPLKGFLAKGIRAYTAKHSGQAYGASGGRNAYAGHNTSKSAVVAESIPLDETQGSRHSHNDGQIYVQKSYGWQHENRSVSDMGYPGSSRSYDEEARIVDRGGDNGYQVSNGDKLGVSR